MQCSNWGGFGGMPSRYFCGIPMAIPLLLWTLLIAKVYRLKFNKKINKYFLKFLFNLYSPILKDGLKDWKLKDSERKFAIKDENRKPKRKFKKNERAGSKYKETVNELNMIRILPICTKMPEIRLHYEKEIAWTPHRTPFVMIIAIPLLILPQFEHWILENRAFKVFVDTYKKTNKLRGIIT